MPVSSCKQCGGEIVEPYRRVLELDPNSATARRILGIGLCWVCYRLNKSSQDSDPS